MTLRRVQKGWPAKGVLSPLYVKHGGRDALAKAAGVSPATLSAVNNGRQNMGIELARKLIDATGVSLVELGGHAEDDDPRGTMILDRLAKLEEEAVRSPDLHPLLEALVALARGNSQEALRVLSEVVDL